VAHAGEIRREAAAELHDVRDHVPPQVRRGRVAVQEDDRVAGSRLDVRDSGPEDVDRRFRRWQAHRRFCIHQGTSAHRDKEACMATAVETEVYTIVAEPLTREAYAPFGTVLSAEGQE